jgi:hypothetical protein
MLKFLVNALLAFALFACGAVAFADTVSPGSVIVTAPGSGRPESLDDQAIYACARTMVTRMFPGATKLRVVADAGPSVFGDTDDDAMPGYEMAMLLKASPAHSDRTLGMAVCDVTPDAHVVSLMKTTRDVLPPEPGVD